MRTLQESLYNPERPEQRNAGNKAICQDIQERYFTAKGAIILEVLPKVSSIIMPRKNKEEQRNYNKEYYSIPENKRKHELAVRKWYQKNREKMRQYSKEYWADPNNKLKNRESKLRQQYGITMEAYKVLNEVQKGLCAICGKPDYKSLAVDHDHKTGKVRGLLCHKCNTAIGMFDDDTNILLKAVDYLEEHL